MLVNGTGVVSSTRFVKLALGTKARVQTQMLFFNTLHSQRLLL
jgi:hypothetical protein